MSLPKIIAVQQDDGSWAAYDDNKYDGENSDSLKIGRGDTRDEALQDLVDAYEWTDAGADFVKQIVFCLANKGFEETIDQTRSTIRKSVEGGAADIEAALRGVLLWAKSNCDYAHIEGVLKAVDLLQEFLLKPPQTEDALREPA